MTGIDKSADKKHVSLTDKAAAQKLKRAKRSLIERTADSLLLKTSRASHGDAAARRTADAASQALRLAAMPPAAAAARRDSRAGKEAERVASMSSEAAAVRRDSRAATEAVRLAAMMPAEAAAHRAERSADEAELVASMSSKEAAARRDSRAGKEAERVASMSSEEVAARRDSRAGKKTERVASMSSEEAAARRDSRAGEEAERLANMSPAEAAAHRGVRTADEAIRLLNMSTAEEEARRESRRADWAMRPVASARDRAMRKHGRLIHERRRWRDLGTEGRGLRTDDERERARNNSTEERQHRTDEERQRMYQLSPAAKEFRRLQRIRHNYDRSKLQCHREHQETIRKARERQAHHRAGLDAEAAGVVRTDNASAHAHRRQERRAADVTDTTAEGLLEALHGSFGSDIVVNAMRISHLVPGTPEYQQCVDAVLQDIAHYGHVDADDTKRQIAGYIEASEVAMCVCAACGLRDIEETYVTSATVLSDVAASHWVRIPELALSQLRAEPPFALFASADKMVSVQRLDFHNIYTVGDASFHVVPEAVYASGKVSLCCSCAKHWDTGTSSAAPQHER